jgi:hypothetical protein
VRSPFEHEDCEEIVRELRGRLIKPIIVYGSYAGIGKLFTAEADDFINADNDPNHELFANKIAIRLTRAPRR